MRVVGLGVLFMGMIGLVGCLFFFDVMGFGKSFLDEFVVV